MQITTKIVVPLTIVLAMTFAGFRHTATQAAESSNGREDLEESKTQVTPSRFNESDRASAFPYLGIAVEQLPDAFASQLPDLIKRGQGLIVVAVADDSPAKTAGIREHDILIRYDDQRLVCPEQLGRLLAGDEFGTTIEIGIVREARLDQVDVTLGERPSSAASMTGDVSNNTDEAMGREPTYSSETSRTKDLRQRRNRREITRSDDQSDDEMRRRIIRTSPRRPSIGLATGDDSRVQDRGRDRFGNYRGYYEEVEPQELRENRSRYPLDATPPYRLYGSPWPGYPDYLYPYGTPYRFDPRRLDLPSYIPYEPYLF